MIDRSQDGHNFQHVTDVNGTERTYGHNVAAGHYIYRVTAYEHSREHNGPGYGVSGSSYGYATPVTVAVDAGADKGVALTYRPTAATLLVHAPHTPTHRSADELPRSQPRQWPDSST